jgi:ADP-ribosyl-[dinitrogen reductase] hydrolase
MFGNKTPIDVHALGNGSLMRAMPLAILGLPFFNVMQGRITHNNHKCSDIIFRYSGLIQDYLNDKNVYKYTKEVKGLLEPSGYIVNTYNNSVYWSCEDSFEEAIIGAVNHGGDADTIAAIAGSLAGAKFGYSAIPERWVNQLDPDVRETLEEFQYFVFKCLQI